MHHPGLLLLAPALGLGPSAILADEITEIARRHLASRATDIGLNEAEVADLAVADETASRHTGVTRVYFQRRVDGIDVVGAIAPLFSRFRPEFEVSRIRKEIGRDGEI